MKKPDKVLALLSQHKGKVVTREQLGQAAGIPHTYYLLSRTLDMHVTRLRKQVSEQGLLILSAKNKGYVLVDDADHAPVTKRY